MFGTVSSVSHFEIVCRLTPSFCAIPSYESPHSFWHGTGCFLNSSICPPYPFFFLSLSCLNRSDGLFLLIRSEFEEVLGIRDRTVFLRDFRERSCGVKIFRCPLPHRGRRDIVPILYYFTKTDSTDDCCQMCAYSLHRGFEIIIGKSYRCERTILPVSRIFIPMFC